MKTIVVCGARPNFMKVAPLLTAMTRFNRERGQFFEPVLVHTGQHYDYEMSKVFFEDLDLPDPDIYLSIGSGTHAEQTGKTMIEFEGVLLRERPDLVVVVGDVNSTLAAALVTAKLCIPLAHVEAGLRSYDKTMPEEINRVLTDFLSDYLFTPSSDASENLKKEEVAEEKVHLVGNIMVDCLVANNMKAKNRPILSKLSLRENGYAVLTLHRPSHVDAADKLMQILTVLAQVAERFPIVFPVHPRTRKVLGETGINHFSGMNSPFLLIDPLGYLDFVSLMMNSRFVVTDSGGVQSETTILGVPCLTLRNTTEWKITVSQGSNILVGDDARGLLEAVMKVLNGGAKKAYAQPDFWDGRTAERVVEILGKNSR